MALTLRSRRSPRAPRAAAPAPGATPTGWAWAGLALGAGAALLLWAPAAWLALAVAQASGGRLRLLDARGSIWNGSAQLLLTGGAGSRNHTALPARVHWQLRPQWGGLRAQLRANCCTPTPLDLRLRLGWNQAQLAFADATSDWPAALLGGLGTPWNTIRPEGRLALRTQALVLRWSAARLQLAGQAQLDALEMGSRLSTLRPMGSYRLLLTGGSTPSLRLSTLDGALQLSGQGQWVGPRLRFTGEARAQAGREAALANLLNIIGRRDGARSVITLG